MMKVEPALDCYDLRLLDALQQEDNLSLASLAERVNLSSSQCSRRIHRLKSLGYIKRQVTLLSARALGLDVEAFVTVTLERHDESSALQFHNAIANFAPILECHAITGDGDYLMKVIARNRQALTDFLMKELMALPVVGQVKTALALTSVKSTTALPLD